MSNVKRGAVRTPVRDSGGTLSHCGICAAGLPAAPAPTKIVNFPDWGGAFARMTQVPLRPWPGWLNLYRAWHLPNSPPCCHPRRHPAAAAGARPPAVGAGAQPYTAGRPTPPQRLKNPMGRTVRDGRRNLCAAVSAKTALQAAVEVIFETSLRTSRLREADMCVDF